ncbi:hypothetical protein [Paucibacter sp. XJ19-41]|uniref:hypothetical protein n=1 Tax=Paucibacter sp. XJ19-41 TaxID=2927824 RepID=UPI00234A3B48|nr:hypothetical protein [Paucibacter sp. XJ19-41]MDC6166713.1 hypothetical protein [Paucibacter sp. XJ19-41]
MHHQFRALIAIAVMLALSATAISARAGCETLEPFQMPRTPEGVNARASSLSSAGDVAPRTAASLEYENGQPTVVVLGGVRHKLVREAGTGRILGVEAGGNLLSIDRRSLTDSERQAVRSLQQQGSAVSTDPRPLGFCGGNLAYSMSMHASLPPVTVTGESVGRIGFWQEVQISGWSPLSVDLTIAGGNSESLTQRFARCKAQRDFCVQTGVQETVNRINAVCIAGGGLIALTGLGTYAGLIGMTACVAANETIGPSWLTQRCEAKQAECNATPG